MTVATSRRAMLVGAVSLPALSIPAVAIETDPDAKLIQFWARNWRTPGTRLRRTGC